jgi:chitodextrinase
MLNFTTKGYIEVYRDGVLISQHTQETKAVESAAAHADENGDGEYRFKYPEKVLRVIGTLAPSADTQAPTQPQNLSATAINRQRIDLSWTASTDNVGVTGYQVFRGGSPLGVATETTYSDTTVTASTTYTYAVAAFDAAGNVSALSSDAQATTPANASPSWQTIASQTLIVGDAYSLNLNSFCTDADADTIQYSITAGTLPSGITRSGATISGTPTTAGESPTVTVRANDGFVNADTTIVFATYTADVTAPPVPTGLAATSASSSQINVSWSASTDAAGSANEYVSGTQDYRLYRSTDGSNFSLRATTTSTSYQDSGLSASTTYYYKIAARDAELNESSQSSAQSATTSSASGLLTDFMSRATEFGVFYYNNFDFADRAALYASNYGSPPLSTDPNHMDLETINVLSGKGCKINVLKTDGEQTASYRHSWVMPVGSQTKVQKKEFYYQFAIYIPNYINDHRFATNGGAAQSHKWAIIQEPDSSFAVGEVVVITPNFRKCVGAYRLRQSTLQVGNTWRTLAQNPPIQPNTAQTTFQTIDAGPQSDGLGNTDVNNQDLYERRYGFLRSIQDGTTNYGTSLSAQGQPDAEQAINGIVWVEDAWNVVEVYVNEATQTIRLWHAQYGQQPKLVIDAPGTADVGSHSWNWTGVQLLPRLEERIADATRQDTYAIYAEVIASASPIKFPGDFSLPAASWWTDLADLTVTRRGNTMDSLRPSGVGVSEFDDCMHSWNGGAYDELRQRFYIVLASGHGNYHDRGTMYYDIMSETWVRLTPRNTASAVGDGSTGIATDGSPLDTHTYDTVVCTPDGRVWVTSMGSVGVSSGVGSPRGWVLDPVGLSQSSTAPYGWTDLGLNTLNGSYDVGAAAYDPITNRVLFAKQQPQGNLSVCSWNLTTLARTQHTVGSSLAFGDSGEDMTGVVVHDGTSNSVLMCKGNGSGSPGRAIATLNLQTLISGGSVSWSIPTWTGAVQPTGKCRIHFNPDTNQLWTWRQGTNQLIVCNRPSNMLTGTYAWFTVTLSGLSITAPSGTAANAVNGTFGRCAQIHMGGRYGGFIVNETTEQPHFWKFPTTAMS